MNQEEIIKQHCIIENTRNKTDAIALYTDRLNNAIDKAVNEPCCYPMCSEKCSEERIWVNNSCIRVKKGFDFYHHSPEKIVEYAVQHRGDYNLLIQEMNDLDLREYPAPNDEGVAYLVGNNGNHRRLVYECIGLPQVMAKVHTTKENEHWIYCINGNRNMAQKIFNWFERIGLVDEYDIQDRGEVRFKGTKNIAAWILPDLCNKTIDNYIHEMQERLELLEKSFYPITHKSFRIIKSKKLWKVSMYIAWFFRKRNKNLRKH